MKGGDDWQELRKWIASVVLWTLAGTVLAISAGLTYLVLSAIPTLDALEKMPGLAAWVSGIGSLLAVVVALAIAIGQPLFLQRSAANKQRARIRVQAHLLAFCLVTVREHARRICGIITAARTSPEGRDALLNHLYERRHELVIPVPAPLEAASQNFDQFGERLGSLMAFLMGAITTANGLSDKPKETYTDDILGIYEGGLKAAVNTADMILPVIEALAQGKRAKVGRIRYPAV